MAWRYLVQYTPYLLDIKRRGKTFRKIYWEKAKNFSRDYYTQWVKFSIQEIDFPSSLKSFLANCLLRKWLCTKISLQVHEHNANIIQTTSVFSSKSHNNLIFKKAFKITIFKKSVQDKWWTLFLGQQGKRKNLMTSDLIQIPNCAL